MDLRTLAFVTFARARPFRGRARLLFDIMDSSRWWRRNCALHHGGPARRFKKATQPLSAASAGCVFKNPPAPAPRSAGAAASEGNGLSKDTQALLKKLSDLEKELRKQNSPKK